jgi:hypothetical protein
MEEREVEAIAARVVKTLLEPENLQTLAHAVAEELRRSAANYRSDIAKLGARLDAHFY